jgi:tRNA pseudouridine-54 N-methylase
MMAQNVKESLIQLNLAENDEIVPDDRLFLDQAVKALQQRVEVLQTAANKVVSTIVKEKVEQEAKFYST